MLNFRIHFIACLFATAFVPLCSAGEMDPENMSLSELEGRVEAIDAELGELASYSLRSGVGAVGYLSRSHEDADHNEWIRIDLDREYTIDQVILVPCIWRDPETGLRADGFPLNFRILAGTSNTTHVVAAFTEEDGLLPRIAPLVVRAEDPVKASWVKVEASRLTRWGWNNQFSLQFSEIMIFSGSDNVAIGQPVTVAKRYRTNSEGRLPRFLVDGFVPYLMDSAQGESSRAEIEFVRTGKRPFLTFDLEESYPVNQVNLHAVDTSHNIPEAAPNGYGMPRWLRVSGANQADFSDEVELFEYRRDSVYDTGPIIIRRFDETPCRYIRIHALEFEPNTSFQEGTSAIGFAEIEILSKGRNVALGKPLTSRNIPYRCLAGIKDGNNFFGKILPIRDWMNQLARRHDLETERPVILAELNQRYARQKTNVRRLSWISGLLAIGVGIGVIAVLILRMLQMHTVARIRERFAADLHDELGANIHGIGMLGDLALRSTDSPDEMKEYLRRSRELTERTGTAIRHCIDLQEAGGLFSNLSDDMHKSAQRILANMECNIAIKGEEILERLKPRIRSDLFLFFKECLVNISRHSEATRYGAILVASPKQILLTISDNGQGLPGGIPHSLTRRAHLLGAKVSIGKTEQGGTEIILRLGLRGKLLPHA